MAAEATSGPLFPKAWILEELTPEEGPWQMAADEWMLRAVAEETVPVVRFYRWRRPQVTFGYFLDAAVAEQEAPGWPHTRRWTGGGVVRHGADVTFSLILPRRTPWAAKPGGRIYEAIHRCIAQAWPWKGEDGAKLMAERSAPQEGAPEVCFRSPVRSDVMWRGHKVAGGALRRTRWGVLYQGSIAAAGRTDEAEGRDRVEAALRGQLAGVWKSRTWSPEERKGIDELVRERYATAAWNEKPRKS